LNVTEHLIHILVLLEPYSGGLYLQPASQGLTTPPASPKQRARSHNWATTANVRLRPEPCQYWWCRTPARVPANSHS